MRALVTIFFITLSLLTFLPAPAAAGPVCSNNGPNPPSDCRVELKGYSSWGLCSHVVTGACAYVDADQRPCVWLITGDFACGRPLPAAVCANNEPNAPADCRVELKGYGSWGVCTHGQQDTCLYVDPEGDLCVYRSRDVVCRAFL